MTQDDTILKHLQDHGRITSLEAVERYGILQTPRRIYNLRQRGHVIETTHISKTRPDGVKIHYGVFTLRD